ncbi:hypothetical protein [Victivallis sp. Marseille-Q1083]|uniref:hypothetical protein n=1 Tax=Victivallis sp. Marseille-Q1083 TaxID=2717288 RepID=UPI00158E7B85|nr:hypothetical protein [Victivallis sp. Marseille-Q1083]
MNKQINNKKVIIGIILCVIGIGLYCSYPWRSKGKITKTIAYFYLDITKTIIDNYAMEKNKFPDREFVINSLENYKVSHTKHGISLFYWPDGYRNSSIVDKNIYIMVKDPCNQQISYFVSENGKNLFPVKYLIYYNDELDKILNNENPLIMVIKEEE